MSTSRSKREHKLLKRAWLTRFNLSAQWLNNIRACRFCFCIKFKAGRKEEVEFTNMCVYTCIMVSRRWEIWHSFIASSEFLLCPLNHELEDTLVWPEVFLFIRSTVPWTDTFGIGPDCPSQRGVQLRESRGIVIPIILQLNLFLQWIHVCLACTKQLKLEHCNRKVELCSHYAILCSLQANDHGLMV